MVLDLMLGWRNAQALRLTIATGATPYCSRSRQALWQKVAYVFTSPMATTFKLARMILPQLEAGTHGVEVVGMMFFDDNLFSLRTGDPVGERLASITAEQNILLMIGYDCAVWRGRGHGRGLRASSSGTGIDEHAHTPRGGLGDFCSHRVRDRG